jgi:hypothetical protein
MLIEAKYKNDRIIATRVDKIGDQINYCQDLAKDRSNGFTRDRTMRRVGSFPTFTLMEYDRLHPGWYARCTQMNDFKDKQKAWREFLDSDYAKPFMMIEKMKH